MNLPAPAPLSVEEKAAIVEHISAVWSALPNRLTPKPTINDGLFKKWFETLSAHYWSPGRYYHNFKHIHSLLRIHHVDQVAAAAKRSSFETRIDVMIDLAIFFHDVIYDPKASDNEEKSAELWREFSKAVGLLTPVESEKVSNWILATKHHGTNSPTLKETDPDLALFLDFDISILAAKPEEYNEYSVAIRAEYNHLEEEVYKKGRRQVLQKFLDNTRLFLTDPFHRIYEPRAKENIKRELDSLQ